MQLVAIIPEHLWLISALNDGVTPEIEEEVTFFAVTESGNEILTAEEASALDEESAQYVARFTK